ncbi:MAG: Omp28 family outer membrane lipoprotein [Muribaculaceae bacterium]|nr:Omp28 family outer membrane lipoprotein [Muribaculaceae bacterium]
MMSNKLFIGLAACAFAGVLTACDNIDENDRYIPVERPEISRVVLIQEFTGMNCVNCPNGAAVLHNLQDQFPGSVIVVGMHPENNPNTMPLAGLNLTSPLATAYYEYFQPNAFPAAMVNGGELMYNTDLWTTSAIKALEVPAAVDLHVTTTYDPASRELKADFETVFNQMYSGELSVLLWVMENNINGLQMSLSGVIRDYSHNHVLRGSLNGTWGQQIGQNFVTEQKITGSGSITLDEKWVPENCEVVALVFQTGSKTVEQAAIAPAIESEESES